MSRDELTQMMVAGEESLNMLVKEPSPELIEFIKDNLEDEDALLKYIPRFEMPKADFEAQVIREMRVVLKDGADKLFSKFKDKTLVKLSEFSEAYMGLENFDYPHKDKLLDFIKYFFLDHVKNVDSVMLNIAALKETMSTKTAPKSGEKGRSEISTLQSRRKSGESAGSYASDDKKKEDKFYEEERMLDIAE